MQEEWKDVEGYEGLYKISNFGRIIALPKKSRCLKNWTRPEQPMKLLVHTNLYQIVWLYKPKFKKKFFVHRLVAIHFLVKIEGKEYVNHKDKDRLNNHVSNLEWMTHAENMHHRDNYKKPINNDPF